MIFGKGNPWIKAVDGTFEFECLYTGLIPDWNEKTIIENMSPFNGERTYIDLWAHMNFDLDFRLFAHSDPVGYYNTVKQIDGVKVYFKPHKYTSAGILASYLKDGDGNDLEFFVQRFTPIYLQNINAYDKIFVTLKSLKPGTTGTQGFGELY